VSTLPIAAATGVVALAAGWLVAARCIRRLRRLLAQARWLSRHDPLTGLPNRTHAEHLFTRRATTGRPTVLVLLDLDGFKQVNDAHGHAAGDQLLVRVASRLVEAIAGNGGRAARLAGDEFLLLLPIHPGGLPHTIETIQRVIDIPVEITTEETVRLTITATAGVTWCEGAGGDWNSLLRQADLALYHARARGLAYEFYRPGMRMPDRPHRYGPRLRDQPPEATA
jgi:diguanylate cyclase (GGDEF)-like protein